MSDQAVASAAQDFVKASRVYRPSGWVVAYANARATFLNFDYVWDKYVGQRIIEADLKHKTPPVPLLTMARLETDAFIAFREAAKKEGLDASINAVAHNPQYKAHLLTQARISNPVYVDATNRMMHHMWHSWALAPGSGLSMISKYITIGTLTGLLAAGVWRYGYHLPERRKIDAFYKSLYAEHPQFWPALAMQKK